MKITKSIVSVFMLCTIAVTARAQTKDVFVNGTLTNMKVMPARIYLVYMSILGMKPDSAEVRDGKFRLIANSGGVVAMATLTTDKHLPVIGKNAISIMLEKGELQITFDGTLQRAAVSGSAASPQREYMAIRQNALDTIAAVNKLKLSDRFKTDTAYQKVIQSAIMAATKWAIDETLYYPLKHPRSVLTPYLTWSQLNSSSIMETELADSLKRNLPANTPEVYKAAIAKLVGEFDKKAAAFEAKVKSNNAMIPLGSKALEFTMNDTQGKPVSLSSFKGKYVLLDFWASWCAPCRAENPNIIKVYDEYKAKGFEVLGVSLDTPAQNSAWLEAIKKDHLTWTELSDLRGMDNAAAKLYHVISIPQNFLIDPSGNIIAKDLRGGELQKKVASLFK